MAVTEVLVGEVEKGIALALETFPELLLGWFQTDFMSVGSRLMFCLLMGTTRCRPTVEWDLTSALSVAMVMP